MKKLTEITKEHFEEVFGVKVKEINRQHDATIVHSSMRSFFFYEDCEVCIVDGRVSVSIHVALHNLGYHVPAFDGLFEEVLDEFINRTSNEEFFSFLQSQMKKP